MGRIDGPERGNIEFHHGGFLTYEHRGEPADAPPPAQLRHAIDGVLLAEATEIELHAGDGQDQAGSLPDELAPADAALVLYDGQPLARRHGGQTWAARLVAEVLPALVANEIMTVLRSKLEKSLLGFDLTGQQEKALLEFIDSSASKIKSLCDADRRLDDEIEEIIDELAGTLEE